MSVPCAIFIYLNFQCNWASCTLPGNPKSSLNASPSDTYLAPPLTSSRSPLFSPEALPSHPICNRSLINLLWNPAASHSELLPLPDMMLFICLLASCLPWHVWAPERQGFTSSLWCLQSLDSWMLSRHLLCDQMASCHGAPFVIWPR